MKWLENASTENDTLFSKGQPMRTQTPPPIPLLSYNAALNSFFPNPFFTSGCVTSFLYRALYFLYLKRSKYDL